MFLIYHFNGSATYSSEGVWEHNLGTLGLDFVALLRRTSTSTSPSALPLVWVWDSARLTPRKGQTLPACSGPR